MSNAIVRTPLGVRLLVAFFIFGALMSGLAGLALLLPSSGLERIWRLNPQAHVELSEFGAWAIALMGMVCVACALSARGLVKRCAWGLYLAIGVLTANLVGDAANAVLRDDLRTLIGLPIGGLLIAYLLRPRIRALFNNEQYNTNQRSA